YSATSGRFISEDPLRFGSGNVSFYPYADNNPINLIDPYGLETGNINEGWDSNWGNWYSWNQANHRPPRPKPGFHCVGHAVCKFTQDMNDALDCFAKCLGRPFDITCGRNSHPPTDPHMSGEAVDVGHGSNPWLATDQVKKCFGQCFPKTSYGQEEYNKGSSGTTHYHFQYGSGRGGATGFSPTIHSHGH